MKNEIIIYQTDRGGIAFKSDFNQATIWATQSQIAEAFEVDVRTVNEHLKNVYKSKELEEKSTIRNFRIVRKEGKREVKRVVKHYDLDAIISVGYRVNSKKATQFRIWATKVLKSHILQGYSVNNRALLENRAEKLLDLQKTIEFLKNKATAKQLIGREKEIFDLLAAYSTALSLLDDYDRKKMKKPKGKKSFYKLKYSEVKDLIKDLKDDYADKNSISSIFGVEKSSIDGIVKNLYQTFDSKPLYPSIEERAAHLLYFFIKDHPFIDGNKRIGAFLFIYFLNKSRYLARSDGAEKIDNGSLTALTLLIAESDPSEKETMIKIVMNLLVG